MNHRSRYHLLMEVFLVGGAVRDKLLGIPVKDHDWVVTGATPQEMLELGYLKVGKDFPVFLHPDSKEEYALARTERKTSKGYYGFECYSAIDVTLEQDLARRDLTINAMAEDSAGNLIDPFNGQQDLNDGVLRHVAPAFAEDPVRILRIARFAARFSRWDFHVAHGTNKLMKQMVNDGEVDALVAERCWSETFKALGEEDPARYFQVLHGCNALAIIFPEIAGLYLADDSNSGDTSHGTNKQQPWVYPLLKTESGESKNTHELRFALLMLSTFILDNSDAAIRQLCKRLRVPTEFRDLSLSAARLYKHIMNTDAFNPETILGYFENCDGLRKPQRFKQALEACLIIFVCDSTAESPLGIEQLQTLPPLLDQCVALNARDIDITGLSGKDIGIALHHARLQLITGV